MNSGTLEECQTGAENNCKTGLTQNLVPPSRPSFCAANALFLCDLCVPCGHSPFPLPCLRRRSADCQICRVAGCQACMPWPFVAGGLIFSHMPMSMTPLGPSYTQHIPRAPRHQPRGLADRSRGLSAAIPPAGGLMNGGTLEECQTRAENNCKTGLTQNLVPPSRPSFCAANALFLCDPLRSFVAIFPTLP